MSKSKIILREIFYPVSFWVLIVYLLLSFITWNVNIATWGWLPRAIIIIWCILLIIIFESDMDNTKKSVLGGKSLEKKIEDSAISISRLFEEKIKQIR